MAIPNNTIPLITIDVAIPIQSFRFEYTLIGKNDLPFIREFTLRLLKISSMSADQLANFLGLTKKEINVVVSQLAEFKEIIVNSSGQIQLTEEAHKYFDISDEARPKITKLFEGINTFKFDLLSFNFIKSNEKLESPLHAMKLLPDNESVSHSIEFARKAFLSSYVDIFEEDSISFENITDLRNIELYKLSDVCKSKNYYIKFPVQINLNLERGNVDRYSESKFWNHEKIQEKLNELLLISFNTSNLKEISKIIDSLNDEILLSCLTSSGIDLTNLTIQKANAKHKSIQNDRDYFIGAITNKNNWEKFKSIIDSNTNNTTMESLYWLAPSDRFWMLNNSSFSYLTELFDSKFFKNKILYIPIGSSNDKTQIKYWNKSLAPIRNHVELIQEGFWGGSVELILIPKKVAIICFYLQQENESISIPFGYSTQNSSEIKWIYNELESYLHSYDSNMEQRKYGKLETR